MISHLSLELCDEVLQQSVVKIFSTKVCITICSLNLEKNEKK